MTRLGSGRLDRRRARLVLAGAALALAVAIRAAHGAPADGYEVSLYRAVPPLFWLGGGLCVVLALGTAVYGDTHRRLALVVAGVAVLAFVALPPIRGYHFYGLTDPLNHLGDARHVRYGGRDLFRLIYPGPHGYAIALTNLTGLSLRLTMMLVVVLFAGVFLLFVPLSIHTLFGDRRLTALGAFSALLVLPVNNVSTFVVFHPFSLAMLFSPFVLYLLLNYLGDALPDTTLPGPLSAGGIALGVSTAALNFLHPQMTVDLIVLLAAVLAVQLALRRYRPDHPLAGSRLLVGQLLFLVVLFTVWNAGQWKLYASIENNIRSLTGTLEGTQQVGADATGRAASARELGVNPVVLFLKIFGVSALYLLLAAWLVTSNLLGQWRRRANREDSVLVTYFTAGGVALAPYFMLQFLGRVSNHFFRHLGFVMVVVTVMGAVGLGRIAGRRGWFSAPRPRLRAVAVALAAVLLVVSLVSVFPSPYLVKPNPHATEQRMEGYADAFESLSVDNEVWFGSIGGAPIRMKSVHRGKPGSAWERDGFVEPAPRMTGAIPGSALDNVSEYYVENEERPLRRDHYVSVSSTRRQTEVVAKRALDYTRQDFRNFTTHDRVERIRDNGGFALYYVDTPCSPVCESAGGGDR